MQQYHLDPDPDEMIVACARCGTPESSTARLGFMVPTNVWKFYIPPHDRHRFICITCWGKAVSARDGGAYQAEHGMPSGIPVYYPLPPGGYEELDAMSRAEMMAWYARADAMPGFRWLRGHRQ
jgi:hypothetical protein